MYCHIKIYILLTYHQTLHPTKILEIVTHWLIKTMLGRSIMVILNWWGWKFEYHQFRPFLSHMSLLKYTRIKILNNENSCSGFQATATVFYSSRTRSHIFDLTYSKCLYLNLSINSLFIANFILAFNFYSFN